MATLYVSAEKVKKDTLLGSAVDENLIRPVIVMVQAKEILPFLGTKLDNALKNKIATSTLTGAYQDLVEDYIQPALVQFVFAQMAHVLRVRFSNNSVSVPSSEQGQAASREDIKPVVDTATHIAEFYREQMVDYLLYNTTLFPEYNQNTGPDIVPTVRNYFSGINVYPPYPYPNRVKAFALGANIKIY